MTDYGLRRRGARCGLWLYSHEMDGSHWDMLLPLALETARYLHDHGWLCIEGETMAASMHPGILVTRSGLEARLALARPETMVARRAHERIDLSERSTPVALADMWSSDRP